MKKHKDKEKPHKEKMHYEHEMEHKPKMKKHIARGR